MRAHGPASPSDEALSRAWQSGDRAAADELVARHQASVRRFLERRVGPRSEDVAQEVWTAVSGAIVSYEQRCSFRTFLYAVANNHVRAAYRAQQRSARIRSAVRDLPQLWFPDPSEVCVARESTQRLAIALRALPIQLQRVVALYYFERLSASAIGAQLSVPEDTIRSRIRRARELLEGSLTGRARRSAPGARNPLEAWLSALGLSRCGPELRHAA